MIFDSKLINANERWLKVFYHDLRTKDFFLNYEEAIYSTKTTKYSIFKNITDDYRINGKFEFILY